MPRAPRTVEDMVHERYADEDVCAAVLQDVADHKTAELIVSGALHLPSEQDAKHWLDRKLGRDKMTPEHRADAEKLKYMEERLKALEEAMKKSEAQAHQVRQAITGGHTAIQKGAE